jgi:glycosyltransferase involved in cell wall biosynthesis
MKVLFISNVFESVATFRLPIIRELKKRGMHVSCLAGRVSLSFADPRVVLNSENVTVHEMELAPASLSPLIAFREMVQIGREIRRSDPDIIFTHTIKPNVLGVLASHWLTGRKNRRIFSTINGLGFTFLQRGLRSGLQRFLVSLLYGFSLRYAERVFFFNQSDLKLFVDHGIVRKERAGYLPGSGVDTASYPLLAVEPSACRFLFIGRLIREKGIFEFVEAARVIRSKYPQCSFEIVGGIYPSPTSVTQAQLDIWRSEEGLYFAGPVSSIHPYLKRSTFVVLPSYREGLSQSLLEAMSSGRGIVTTRVPGCEELVVEGVNGFLCEPKSSYSLGEAMERAALDFERAGEMGLVSRRIASEKFSYQAMLSSLFEQVKL